MQSRELYIYVRYVVDPYPPRRRRRTNHRQTSFKNTTHKYTPVVLHNNNNNNNVYNCVEAYVKYDRCVYNYSRDPIVRSWQLLLPFFFFHSFRVRYNILLRYYIIYIILLYTCSEPKWKYLSGQIYFGS